MVGRGPSFRRSGAIPPARLLEVRAAEVGDELDVLLDDGRIVRTQVRANA